MNEKRTYKRYPPSFKEEAVALVTEQGYTVIETAKSLGIRTNQLYDWKAKFEAEKSGEFLSTDEREKLKRLRKSLCHPHSDAKIRLNSATASEI